MRLWALQANGEAICLEVSFLQVGSNQDRGKAELPDFLSLFRAPEEAPEEGSPEAARSEPEATEDERPKSWHAQEHMARSSQDASWCKEELQRQRRALEAAQGAQRSFAAEAEEQRRRQAALDAELVQLQHADGVAQQALERLQHDVANSTQAAEAPRVKKGRRCRVPVEFQTTGDGNTPELPTFGALAVAGAGTEELEELHVAEVQQLQSQVWELQKRLGEGFGPRCESPVKAIQANPDSNPRRSEIVDSKECVQSAETSQGVAPNRNISSISALLTASLGTNAFEKKADEEWQSTKSRVYG
eukprot:g16387.t1